MIKHLKGIEGEQLKKWYVYRKKRLEKLRITLNKNPNLYDKKTFKLLIKTIDKELKTLTG